MDFSDITGGDETSKIYEARALEHDRLAPEIKSGLKIVEEFIKKRGRIIVGGLSIDILLRAKGKYLYPEDMASFPDLDCISPDSVRDSQDLADILYNAGMPNVSAIGALHIQTRRVRIDGRVVADISYVSPLVYDYIPYLTINGLKIIHPLYQRADQHMACSKLFIDPPREVCFNRLKKDIERFNLLDECYPCIECLAVDIRPVRENVVTGTLRTVKQTIPVGAIIHGYAAYAALLDGAKKILKIEKFDNEHIIDVEYKIAGDKIEFQSPFEEMHFLIDLENDEYFKNKPVEYEPLLDMRPQMFLVDKQEYWNIHGLLISVGTLDNLIVPSIQYVLLFMLMGYFYHRRDINIKLYISLLKVLELIEDTYKPGDNSPYFIPTNVYGKTNLSESQEIKLMRIKADLGTPSECLTSLPPNYWPETSRHTEYTYDCWFFDRSGRKIK